MLNINIKRGIKIINTNPEKIIKNILGTQTTRKARPVRRQPVRRMRQSTNGIDNTECENMSNKECLADTEKEYCDHCGMDMEMDNNYNCIVCGARLIRRYDRRNIQSGG